MEFRTIIPLSAPRVTLDYSNRLLLLGSCFAESMAERLLEGGFQLDCNPFGTLYNPLSVAAGLRRLYENRLPQAVELFSHEGCWHSFAFHSRFSHPDPQEALRGMCDSFEEAHSNIEAIDRMIVTWGSAFVYIRKNGEIVANCHKLPEKTFSRRRLSVEEIVSCWRTLLAEIRSNHSEIEILFTVSPIRHLRDGAHENQLSKSTLLLAIDTLCQEFEFCHYFPSYEIVLDELRDYRFYASDMVHVSDCAIDYIWARFSEVYLTQRSQQALREWKKLQLRFTHRPLHAESPAYKDFCLQNLFKAKQFREKFPFFVFPNDFLRENSK